MFQCKKFLGVREFLISILILFSLIFTVNGADLNNGLAALKAKEFETAYNELKPLAELGDERAQYNLARMYSKGDFVSLNHSKALDLYRKSAEQGYEKSLNNLGLAYYLGNGVKKDYQMAYMYMGVAAELGHKRSMQNLRIVAGEMSKKRLLEAKIMIEACVAKYFIGCEKIKP